MKLLSSYAGPDAFSEIVSDVAAEAKRHGAEVEDVMSDSFTIGRFEVTIVEDAEQNAITSHVLFKPPYGQTINDQHDPACVSMTSGTSEEVAVASLKSIQRMENDPKFLHFFN